MSGYDENLLKNAPEATRKERQEGYNLDLLQPERTATPPVRPASAQQPPTSPQATASFPSDVPPSSRTPVSTNEYAAAGPATKENYSSLSQDDDREGGLGAGARSKPSFIHTGKGKAIIAIAVILALAAIIGGAVGGTVGHHSSSNAATSPSSSPGVSGGGGSTNGNGATGAGTSSAATAPGGADPTSAVSSQPAGQSNVGPTSTSPVSTASPTIGSAGPASTTAGVTGGNRDSLNGFIAGAKDRRRERRSNAAVQGNNFAGFARD